MARLRPRFFVTGFRQPRGFRPPFSVGVTFRLFGRLR
jgi:hypothetical protein